MARSEQFQSLSSLGSARSQQHPDVRHSIPRGVLGRLRARFASARLGLLLFAGTPLINGCPIADDDDSAADPVDLVREWCDENPDNCELDLDGDGFNSDEECDDFDPATHPGADELPYDGVDQDCDGEDLTDVDGDGVDATQAEGTDCDDGDPTVYPGAEEVCDGDDQDCDGEEDEAEDLDPADPSTPTWGPDQDVDGIPECDDFIVDCEQPNDLEVPGGQPIQYLSCNEEGLSQ